MHTLYYLWPKKVYKDNGKVLKDLSRFNLYFVTQWSNELEREKFGSRETERRLLQWSREWMVGLRGDNGK